MLQQLWVAELSSDTPAHLWLRDQVRLLPGTGRARVRDAESTWQATWLERQADPSAEACPRCLPRGRAVPEHLFQVPTHRASVQTLKLRAFTPCPAGARAQPVLLLRLLDLILLKTRAD